MPRPIKSHTCRAVWLYTNKRLAEVSSSRRPSPIGKLRTKLEGPGRSVTKNALKFTGIDLCVCLTGQHRQQRWRRIGRKFSHPHDRFASTEVDTIVFR